MPRKPSQRAMKAKIILHLIVVQEPSKKWMSGHNEAALVEGDE